MAGREELVPHLWQEEKPERAHRDFREPGEGLFVAKEYELPDALAGKTSNITVHSNLDYVA